MSEPEPHVLTVAVDRGAGGIDIVTLRGELDFASGEPLSSAFADLTPGPRRVVVDLTELEFVDSSGVKMIVAAARAVEDAGGTFVLAAPTPTVRRVVEILHLDDVLTIVENRQAALDEIADPWSSRARSEAADG